MPPILFGPTLRACGARWISFAMRPGALPRLMISDEPGEPGDILFDPDTLKEGEPGMMYFAIPSPNAKYVLLGLYDGVISPTTLRVVDVDKRTLLPDRIETLSTTFIVPAAAWLADSSGFYWLKARPGTWRGTCSACTIDRQGPRDVMLHRLGGPVATATELRLDLARCDIRVSADGHYATVIHGFEGSALPRASFIKDLRNGGEWRPFLADVEGRCMGEFAGESYLAITTVGAPNGRVVRIPVNTPTDRASWAEIVPESDRIIYHLAIVGGQLVLGLLNDTDMKIALYGLDGRPEGEVPLTATPASIMAVSNITPCPGGFLFVHGTWTTPPTPYRYDFATGEATALAQRAYPGRLTHRRFEAVSSDGARVPYHLVHRADLDLTVPHPVLITGYGGLQSAGGLNSERMFTYGRFYDAGGIYVWSCVRGDGHLGEAYYRQGRLQNRKKGTLDLIAVAESLVAKGIAEPGRIGLTGGSGSGILSATAVTQRPDLFNAIVIYAGLLADMLRYTQEPCGGHSHIYEWGDPTKPEFAPALADYSPYRNVRAGTQYPPMLVTSTGFDNLPDWHARKFVAALQHANASAAPILLHVTSRGVSPVQGDRAVNLDDFVMHHLKMNV
jgi:prolyl oligopeptidase